MGLHRSDVDAALDAREVVISWLNRGTLHLVRSEDHAWLHALTAPTLLTTNARRLAQEGVSPDAAERGVCAVERALTDGPRTRDELREVVLRADVPVAGQALVHVLLAATLRGLVVRGPVRGGQQAFVLLRDWLGVTAPVDREVALAELARRYLAGHGPATATSLCGPDCRSAMHDAGSLCWAAHSSSRTGWPTSPASRQPRRCPGRGCSAASSRCCSAGCRARRSSDRIATSSP